MKKTLLISLLSLAIGTALHANQANAQEGNTQDKADTQWIGVFGHYYRADEEKFPNIQTFEEGDGYGFEYGFRFSNDWATRVELTKIKMDEGKGRSGKLSGESIGIDALYFLNGSDTYVFAGARYQDFYDSRRLMAAGLGKHWQVNDNWNIITEAGVMHDFGEAHRDVIAKLGVAYSFGGNATSTPVFVDSDRDGVADSFDRCAQTTYGVQVDAMGCEIVVDSDNDGIKDSMDNCPSTAPGATVDAKGCAVIKDMDNDGVADNLDKCANTPSTDKVDKMGCSIFEEKEVSKSLVITFPSESAAINKVDQANLDEFVAFLRRYPNTDAVIEGHASAPGNADYNMALSQKRADSVKQLLVNKYGIDSARLTTVGFGETQLLDESNTAAAHKKNRRITARVSKSIRVKVKQ